MLTTVLFDLDGTLLPMDAEAFERIYFRNLCKVVPGWSPEACKQAVWAAVTTMVKDTGPATNEAVFYEAYAKFLPCPLEEALPLYDRFYQESFVACKQATRPSQVLQEAVRLLQKKGYTVAIATNPIFPQAAIMQRIQWAGFAPEEFAYITTFEQSHACKPQPSYYTEILQALGTPPEACLMVGNDELEDLVAGQCGMQTYLIKDCVIRRPDALKPTYAGDATAFLTFAQQLPPISI